MRPDLGSLMPLGDPTGELREMAFCSVVGLVARRGGSLLIGSDFASATDAYRGSLIGSDFPSFWMEAPLAGGEGFDLHVYYDRGQVAAGERFGEGHGFGMQALFDWYFGAETGGVGVGFAHDLRAGERATGVYVNFKGRPLSDERGFFSALGAPEAHQRARRLVGRLPRSWEPWYLGMFPERQGAGVRVGAFAGRRRQHAYASDPAELARDLAQAGFEAFDGGMLERVSALAASPFGLELQLDATEEGVGDVLGVDLTLGGGTSRRVETAFAEEGPAARDCRLLEEWGIADARWCAIAPASLSKAVPIEAGGRPALMLMSCSPSFIKAKWQDARLLGPAKVYLHCQARLLGMPE